MATISDVPFCTADLRHYRAPRHMVSGDGSITAAAELLNEMVDDHDKARPVLVVVDADLVTLGLAAPLIAALEQYGRMEVWSPPRGEPTIETANELARVARATGPRAVVGLGGGSALDLSKVAGAAVTNAEPVRNFIGLNRVGHAPVPLVLIPTTSGTGSEVTGVCTLLVEGRKAVISSARLVPEAAVLDPLLTLSLPRAQTAATGLDALSHALESLLSTNSTALTAAAAVGAAGSIARNLETSYRDGSDLPARRALLYGAHLAGIALNASVVIGHSIAYTIANRTGLPHGVTCALALPYCLRYNAVPGNERLTGAIAAIGDALGGKPGVGRSEVAANGADDLARDVHALATRLDIPISLQAVGIVRGQLREMTAECLALYARPNNPLPVEVGGLTLLYEHLYEGDLENYRGPLPTH